MSASRGTPPAVPLSPEWPAAGSPPSFGAGPRELVRRVTGARGDRQVLVLQGRIAFWARWRDGRVVAEHVEDLERSAAAATRCPWPDLATGDETFVDVVVDSPLDDIERALAGEAARPESTSAGGADRARRAGSPGAVGRWSLGRRLAREHRDADVRLAPPEVSPLLAALLRSELPGDWYRRLEALQSDTVTVRVLHSAIRLREPSGEERHGDVLRVLRGGGAERHLLYRAGCPTFTRVVTPADESAAAAALEETRAHLLARHGVVDARVVRDTDPRLPVAFDGASELVESGGSAEAAGGARRAEPDVGDARRLAKLVVSGRRRARPIALPALLDKWRRHVELRRLHAATALTAAIAGLTVIASVVHGIDGARRRARALDASEALVARHESLADAVDARHPAPALAEASLALVDGRISTGAAPDAADLLGALAAVLTAHPAVGLDRLAWSTETAADSAIGGALDTPSSLPLRGLGDTGPPVARLEIAGRIAASGFPSGPEVERGDASVRERQARFEAFVGALERDVTFDDLEVRLSPAVAAADGERGMRSFAGGAEGVDYQLSLRRAAEEWVDE